MAIADQTATNDYDEASEAMPASGRLGPRLIAISQRHSRFVGAMKLVLPATAVVLIAIVLAWPGVFDGEAANGLSFTSKRARHAQSLTMVNPRYHGTDREGRPFMITAEQAAHDPKDPTRISLETLLANVTMTDGTWITLTARGGVYHQTAQSLDLNGPVRISSDNGYEFRAGNFAIDLNEGTAVSDTPVHGQGPVGQLSADRMRVEARGRKLVFEDNVSVTLFPARAR